MIAHLTENQFFSLPSTSLHYPCDKCNKQKGYGTLIRDIADCCLIDGEIVTQEAFTALYLCNDCHWQVTCEYTQMKRDQVKQQQLLRSNEARWLQKVSQLPVQELANRVGVSRQAYYKWLRGKTITDEHKERLKEMIANYTDMLH
jgi:DNA-binding XRE family transcriptional regulator